MLDLFAKHNYQHAQRIIMTERQADNTKVPMEITLADHMGQFIYKHLGTMLRQARESYIEKPGFFFIQFATTHLSQKAPKSETFWFDEDTKEAGMPVPIHSAHIRQFKKEAGDRPQIQSCAFLFQWRKEQLQQSIVFSLPELLEHKDLDRTQFETVGNLLAAQTVKDFVQKRFLKYHRPLFSGDMVSDSSYRWAVSDHTVSNLLHMTTMHQRSALVDCWVSLGSLRQTMQELCKGRDVRIHLAFDRKSVQASAHSLEAAQGTAVGVVAYTYEHVENKTHVHLMFAYMDSKHEASIRAPMEKQMADFGTLYLVDQVSLHDPDDASDLYAAWWKTNKEGLRKIFIGAK
jgi:hypothetical protein